MVYNGVLVETVREVLQRVNDPEICTLYWSFLLADAANTIFLPFDFLDNTGQRVTGGIFIDSDSVNYPNLAIDPLAFRSSQNSLSFHSLTLVFRKISTS